MQSRTAGILSILEGEASRNEWKQWLLSSKRLGPFPPSSTGLVTRCWLWKGGHTSGGYADVHVSRKGIKIHLKIVKLVAFLWKDWDPESGEIICHQCDNRGCWRPSHIYIGTHSTNAQDRGLRNRQSFARGESHGLSKLNEAEIRDIRHKAENGYGPTALALQYDVSHATISHILHGKTWSHVR